MENEAITEAKKRVLNLLDLGSFIEIDELKEDGVIAGYGTILSRPVCVFSQDSSVMNGAITSKNCEKICKIIDMAIKTGVMLIGFYDSIGSKIDEGTDVFIGLQKVLSKLANASGVIPQISVIAGSVTGIATFAASFSDFVFMIKDKSKMFINGPQVLTAATGKDVTVDGIGGADVHFNKTGVCQFICENDEKCLNEVKELISYLPDNNLVDAEIIESDDFNRICDELLEDDADARKVINSICDCNKFLEVSSGFAKSVIIGFARIGGRVLGIVATGEDKIDIAGAKKASKFVRFCDAFNIPVVTLIDNDGFRSLVEEELNGLVKESARLLFAYSDATVPKVNIIYGKAFSGANLMFGTSADMVLAWDKAKISVIEPIKAVNILYSEEITNSEAPIEFRENKLKEYMETNALPKNAVGFIDSVISPVDTRKMIISALDMFSSKRERKNIRKHESLSF